MKKLVLSIILIVGLAGAVNAAPNWAQKRRNLALRAMQVDIQLVPLLTELKQIQRERNSLPNGEDFKDSDFLGGTMPGFPPGVFDHLDAQLMIDFIETVAPQFTALYENNNTNRNVMNKLKP